MVKQGEEEVLQRG